MRTESDLQWSPHSGAPGCHRCGLPLLAGATYCPYCERRLKESGVARLMEQGRRLMRRDTGRRIAGIREGVLLTSAAAFFLCVAVASAIAAIVVSA